MVKTCFKCGRSKEEVKLLDAIFGDEIVKICEECSLLENIPIIRRPTTSQLRESERGYTVEDRLRRMAGLQPEEKPEEKGETEISLDDLRKKEGKDKFELAKERNVPLALIDNFNWHVLMARKKKKLTRRELADLLGESEAVIRMIENKEMPDDPLRLIKKLEQFFGIKLRKEEAEEESVRIREAIKSKLVREREEEKPSVILKLDNKSIENLTIADLQEMKKRKEELEEKKEEIKEKEEDVSALVEEIKDKERERQEGVDGDEEEKLLGNDVEIENGIEKF